jgi:hypothetical protein
LDKNEIAGLIEALCDGPLEPSAELLALRREAASLLAKAGDDTVDADALMTALAASLSGSANKAARKTLAELVTQSASARLDAESAACFVETIDRAAEPAPAHLVEEFFEAEAAAIPRAAAANFWSRIADRLRSAYGARIAAACVVLVASAATWSLYWREGEHFAGPPAPPAANIESFAPAVAKPEDVKPEGIKPENVKREDIKRESAPTESTNADSKKTDSAKTESARSTPTAGDVPAPAAAPKPAMAARQPCEPRGQIREALKTREPPRTRSSALGDEKADARASGAASGCDAAPAEDAERARQNAPAGTAPASAAIGTVQTEAAPAQTVPAEPRPGTAGQPAASAAKPASRLPAR